MSLLKIQTELKAPKNQFNAYGNYSYRSAEDVLEALKPLLLKYEATLTIYDEITEVAGRVYVKATATISCEGTGISVCAFAREADTKKGMDAAQITGSASSYARKYALNGLFLIDDTRDPDATNKHDKEEKPKTVQQEAQAKPMLFEDTEEYQKAIEYLAKPGGSMTKIKQKYNVPKKTEDKLLQASTQLELKIAQDIDQDFDKKVQR